MKEFTLDFSDFAKKSKILLDKILPEVAEKAMATAGMQLLNDAVMEVPTVPIKEGFLRGSGSVHVQNKLVYVSPYGKPGKAATTIDLPIKKGQITATAAFNTSYCARLHESIGFHFSEPSSGPKFLESKLIRNKERYFTIIANVIKKGGK